VGVTVDDYAEGGSPPAKMEGSMAAILTVSNLLTVAKENLDLDQVRSKFTRPNPRFFENARLGFSNFGVSRTSPSSRKTARM